MPEDGIKRSRNSDRGAINENLLQRDFYRRVLRSVSDARYDGIPKIRFASSFASSVFLFSFLRNLKAGCSRCGAPYFFSGGSRHLVSNSN